MKTCHTTYSQFKKINNSIAKTNNVKKSAMEGNKIFKLFLFTTITFLLCTFVSSYQNCKDECFDMEIKGNAKRLDKKFHKY